MKPEEKKNNGKIFVVSGPSGSGKTTLRDQLLKKRALKGMFVKSVSFTTRPKRSGERNGRDYFFISKKEFKEKQKTKKILEWTKYLGYYYATPKEPVDRELKIGKHIILCLDLKGAIRIKRLYPKNAVTVFISPPSVKELRCRIEGRCHKTKKEEVRQRLKLAKRELLSLRRYDYSIVNKNLEEAVKRLENIVMKETAIKLKRG